MITNITPQFAGRAPRKPEPPRVLIYDAVSTLPPLLIPPTPAERRARDLYLRALARRARNSESLS